MNFHIPEGLVSKLAPQILKIKAKSPKILFVAGVVGVVGSAVLACRATLKLSDTLDEFKGEIDTAKAHGRTLVHFDSGTNIDVDVPKTSGREMAVVYSRGTFRVVRLYAPAVILGSLSIAALAASHRELSRRNTALASAYSALHASYEAYRARIREEIGVEKELDIYQNARYEKQMIDGKSKTVRVVDDPTAHSPYAVFFDETSTEWTKSPEQNKMFLMAQQNYWNHRLHVYGYVFLNEVLYNLGLERTSAGQVVGWRVNGNGDGFIDFGIHDINNAKFVNGVERSILLDFNVDGVIYKDI